MEFVGESDKKKGHPARPLLALSSSRALSHNDMLTIILTLIHISSHTGHRGERAGQSSPRPPKAP